MRRCVVAGMLLLMSAQAEAKLDPLRGMKESLIRAEVVIVLDTSGSMSSGVCSTCSGLCSSVSGSDCYGDRSGTVDLPNDGLCTGAEDRTTQPADCTLDDNDNPATGTLVPAGRGPSCASGGIVSRFAMVKRALRGVLPELRRVANVALVTFQQSGYYTYSAATSALPSKPVSMLLTEWEMKRLGAWDTTNDRPAASFSWPTSAGTGVTLTLTSGSTLAVAADSLYRQSRDSTVEARYPWATAGKRTSAAGHDWVYVGSYYTFDQAAIDIAQPTRVEASYQGPQFNDGATTWVYKRYGHSICEYVEQGMDGTATTARLVQGLVESQAQPDQDAALGGILANLNDAPNGGLFAVGNTPLGPGIDVARAHFADRQAGTGPFAGPDPAATCRPRFVFALSDGSSFDGSDPSTAAASLYALDTSNPIKTFVIGLPGSDMTALNAIAASGGTGAAIFAGNEQQLLVALKDTLFAQLEGSYATTAPGVATSVNSTVVDNLGLLGSTRYPGWRGHLRAVDVTTKCGGPTPPPSFPCAKGTCVDGRCELWDAGQLLETRDWKTRKIYTGLHTVNSGYPVPLIGTDVAGTACTSAGAAPGCSSSLGIESLWSAVTGTSAPADLGPMLQWLAGKDREWKLPAIIRSVPATVGPPPTLASVSGHDELETRQAARQRLAYVNSSEGLIHAFDVQSGSEVFAYVPAHSLPAIYEIYKQGGQDTDPERFQWVSGASPRVEDLKDAGGLWQTYLLQTDGPGGSEFVVLDITDPSHCTNPLDSTSCTVNAPPVTVVFDSRVASPSLASTFGQTWSLPALFWTTGQSPRAAMGSGYDVSTPGAGSHYHLFKSVAPPWGTATPTDVESLLLGGLGAQVHDYAVLADTVAVYDPTGSRDVIATYQADLNGRITRFERGETALTASVLGAADGGGPGHPLYYAPAALYRTDLNRVSLAANSGAFQEADSSWNPSFESRLYMRMEDSGSVDPAIDNVTCEVSQICSGACFSVPSSCSGPSARALPLDSPTLVRNALAGDRLEAFYLYYDPPTTTCSGNRVALGDSWLIRIASDGAGTSHSLVQAKRLGGTQVTGMSLVGGGSDLILMKSGRGGERAAIETLSGAPVTSMGLSGAPILESWREVR